MIFYKIQKIIKVLEIVEKPNKRNGVLHEKMRIIMFYTFGHFKRRLYYKNYLKI